MLNMEKNKTYGVGRRAMAAVALLGLFLVAAPQAQATENTVAKACADVLGLSPADTLFQSCTVSLTQSAQNAAYIQAQAAVYHAAAQACADAGVQPGDAAYSMCVYTHANPTVAIGDVVMGAN